MKNLWKIIIVLILASSVVAVVVLKNKEKQSQVVEPIIENPQPVIAEPNQETAADSNNQLVASVEPVAAVVAVAPKKSPMLIDLGADKCVPCKMMMPVLEELTTEYKGKLEVVFYDVWKDPAPGQKFGIRLIPTQIFVDPNGKELFRHEGFFAKEDILAKWKELGFDLR